MHDYLYFGALLFLGDCVTVLQITPFKTSASHALNNLIAY
jgi:hypothetical protein